MKPSVFTFTVRDRNALYSAYMPQIEGGGIFIPTERPYRLMDEVYMLLSLPEEASKIPVSGKVVWLTPPNAMGNRVQGIGVRFDDDENGRSAKAKIEALVSGMSSPNRPTHTM
ncbi:MAG: pilus assembly protein PilZ [Burkholderiales bacterium]|nr:pilus assembly protein PilZ [Burkholderiales bacterium]